MLEAIRRLSKNIIVKIFFALLVVSFAIWGIGDFVRLSALNSEFAAKVGGVKIGVRQFEEFLSREQADMREKTKGQISRDILNSPVFKAEVLYSMVRREVTKQEIEKMGFFLGSGAAAKMIESHPAFQKDGKFSPQIFKLLLAGNHMTEQGFIANLKESEAASMLTGAISAVKPAPKVLAEAAAAYKNEIRSADYILIPHGFVKETSTPAEEALKEFYNGNKHLFETPEKREASYFSISESAIAEKKKPTDAEIDKEHSDKLAAYEKRKLLQILFKDETKAKEAHAKLAKGEDFYEVAKALAGQSKEKTELGELSIAETTPDVAKTAFKLSEGGYSAPEQTPFGWRILKVVSIKQDREALRREIALEAAKDEISGLVNKLDDQIAGGANIKEMAAEFGSRVLAASFEKGAASKLPLEVQNSVFETKEGQFSGIIKTAAGEYFVVKVDKVTPSRIRDYAEVKQSVLEKWRERKTFEKTSLLAKEVIDGLKKDPDIAKAASKHGLKLAGTGKITRLVNEKQTSIYTQKLLYDLFTSKTGDVIGPYKTNEASEQSDYIIAKLGAVEKPKPNAEEVNSLKKEMEQAAEKEIINQYMGSLSGTIGVQVNEKLLLSGAAEEQ